MEDKTKYTNASEQETGKDDFSSSITNYCSVKVLGVGNDNLVIDDKKWTKHTTENVT